MATLVERPNWGTVWMQIAEVLAQRSTCPRLHTAAVIVSFDNRVLSTGYNGSPKGAAHCSDDGCLMEDNHCTRAVHAELNAILYAASRGIAIEGSSIYVLHAPCVRCAIAITQADIWEVNYLNDYGDLAGVKRLQELGVDVKKLDANT